MAPIGWKLMRRWRKRPSMRTLTSRSTSTTPMMLRRAKKCKSRGKNPRMSRTLLMKVITKRKTTYPNKKKMMM